MRVVKDTASYGYFGQNVGETENNVLAATVLPSNFSGPKLLKKLIGKCYNFTQDQYQYTFCPFQNFSQFELSLRWNAYRGILGIWSHWNIQNNTFSSMMYNQGDKCGNIERSVQVYFQCGPTEVLLNVTEPQKCSYAALFETKYVCHNDSLVVYPRLPAEFQKKWDELLTEYHHGYITEKGYNSSLEKLLEVAGFSQKKVSEVSEKVSTVAAPTLTGSLFTDLSTCNKEYKAMAKEVTRLNQEMDALKLLLDLAKIENRTKPHQ